MTSETPQQAAERARTADQDLLKREIEGRANSGTFRSVQSRQDQASNQISVLVGDTVRRWIIKNSARTQLSGPELMAAAAKALENQARATRKAIQAGGEFIHRNPGIRKK